ncbi:hypothetical protein AX16_008687 [Volvariella volvacea WC 439]|nr:hypothetical protein AX16_008687 [Volvariella volvacea WC 439]
MSDDWDTKVVIGYKRNVAKVTKKDSDLNGTDHQRIAKLDRDNEVAPPPKVSLSVGRAIQTARLARNLTQKDVAQKINEKPTVLQDYENGKATPNPQILGKLERVLGVKLRGSDIGKPLEGPKKS